MNQLIAVTSQNRKTITGHTGVCRKFWLYPVHDGQPGERRLLELAKEESFRAYPGGMPPGLEGIQVLISAGMGQGMVMRLQRLGVTAWITRATDPDAAVQAFLRGEPSAPAEEPGVEHDHDHDEDD